MKTHILSTFIFIFCLSHFSATGQSFLGAFEAADQQLYYVEANPNAAPSLNPIQQFRNEGEDVQANVALGAVYSQQYQRIMAVYANEAGEVIAHAATLAEGQAIESKMTFGMCYEANYGSWFAVVMTDQDQLLAVRVTY